MGKQEAVQTRRLHLPPHYYEVLLLAKHGKLARKISAKPRVRFLRYRVPVMFLRPQEPFTLAFGRREVCGAN